MVNEQTIRKDFPIFSHRSPFVYLDSTATALKPQSVVDACTEYYTQYSANIFRGVYDISEHATQMYEDVRIKVADFIHAKTEEIIFTRNTTESLNLICNGWLAPRFQSEDECVTTLMEHHSNFVPWQQLCIARKGVFRVLPLENYTISIDTLQSFITPKTKVFAMTAVSNVIGTMTPVAKIVAKVRELNPNCLIVIDAAQAVPHSVVDVAAWDADFVAFSSHKMLGPTGVGVLWGKAERLEEVHPTVFGGEMVREVQIEKTYFQDVPHRFEAGTPDIAGVIGLGAAVDYLSAVGMENVREHERIITAYACQKFADCKGVNILGTQDPTRRAGIVAFTVDGVHPHDAAQILNEDGICVRSGHHCAMPLHTHLGVVASVRASFYIYTTTSDIDALIDGIAHVQRVFSSR